MTKYQIGILRKLLFQAVLARDEHRCRRCGSTKALSPSHIYPKGTYRKMEFYLENVLTLCYRCHLQFWHKNPIEAWEWLRTELPQETLEKLKLRTQVIDKTPQDYNAIKLFLESKIK